MSSVKTIPLAGAPPSTRFTLKIAFSTTPARECIVAVSDEIDRIAGAIKATHPEFRYQPITEPAESGNGGLVRWVSGRPGEAPAYAGTDFIIARDGPGLPPFIFFSTNYPDLDSAVLRHRDNERFVGKPYLTGLCQGCPFYRELSFAPNEGLGE